MQSRGGGLNEYIVYFIVWTALVLLLSFFIRFMISRISRSENQASKNSLFTLLMLIGIPLTLLLLITSIVVLGSDKPLGAEYKLLLMLFAALIIIIVYYGHRRK